ncbi:proteoglycan 4b isoform X2 [Tachysurus fulvidraco]|uniref:proteoglycan 4b isoform X2 n=1 Tax=Tachysurus fulvidraco TaxID=1234273 RepID=UPI001FEE99A3|nr:proteoglycan 4b isoform X2 [Tachysurus fulvidraco]
MSSSVGLLLLSACVLFTCSSAQKSCRNRCGEAYSRSNECQCDYECLSHNECCRNYESVCTERGSCKGRCGEHFKRGRQCHCDIECIKYRQCCPDYETQCTTEDSSMEEEYSELEVSTPLDYTASEGITVSPLADKDPDILSFEPEQLSPNNSDPNFPPISSSQAISQEPSEQYAATTSPTDITPASEQTDLEADPTTTTTTKPTAINPQSVFEQDTDTYENQTELRPDLLDSGTVPSITVSPLADKDPDIPSFEPEQLSPNNSDPNFPPISTSQAISQEPTQEPSEQFVTTTSPTDITPASEQTDLKADPTTPTTTEPTAIHPQSVFEQDQPSYVASVPTLPPKMASPRPNSTLMSEQSATTNSQSTSEPEPTPSASAQANNTDHEPSNPDDRHDPEVNLENQTDAQLEPSENTTQEIQEKDSTDKPTAEKITEAQNETQNMNIIHSTKDSPTDPALIETPASMKVSLSPTKMPEKPIKPIDPSKNLQDLQEYQADTNSDTNLCSDLPVNGLTTLRNGSVVVFRGHYFWMLDSRRKAGPAQSITEFWGIPSPIDTVFTRCNCHGKTYIFRGDKYWRFENDIMDVGFPRPISEGFGLRGQVVAALSMPQYRSRRESVLFFKTGGLAQRYSYLNKPNCGSKSTAVIVKRLRREAVPSLGPQLEIRKTWLGFPPTVTSAVSVRTTGGDGYKYYVFSPSKYYSLKMEGDTPVILTPRAGQEKQKSAKRWFRCPETSSM